MNFFEAIGAMKEGKTVTDGSLEYKIREGFIEYMKKDKSWHKCIDDIDDLCLEEYELVKEPRWMTVDEIIDFAKKHKSEIEVLYYDYHYFSLSEIDFKGRNASFICFGNKWFTLEKIKKSKYSIDNGNTWHEWKIED